LVLFQTRAWAANAEAIPAGTKITIQNWQQYRQFMSDGMVALFEGKYAFKMPNDVENRCWRADSYRPAEHLQRGN